MTSGKMLQVMAKPQALIHFKEDHPLTVGKVYDFPNIIFDNGRTLFLSNYESAWTQEFDFF